MRLPARLRAAALLGLAAALLLSGCATHASVTQGREAELRQDYDLAVVAYTKALRANPSDRGLRLALDRARLRASQDHFARGRRHTAVGRLEEALVEYQLAAELNPASGGIQDELRAVRAQLKARVAVAREGQTRLEALVARSLDAPLPGTDLPAGVALPRTLTFRDAPARDVFAALGKLAGLSIAYDAAYRDQTVSLDLREASLEQALTSTAAATRHFWRVTGPRTVTVIPDTPAKRREYEEEIVRTFYLSNADLKETIDVLRIVVDARRVAPVTGTNAITIKDIPERVAAAGRIIQAIDKARPEVVIDVELLEVNRTRLREYGLQVASPATDPSGLNGQISVPSSNLTLEGLRSLTASDVALTSLPALYYRLLRNDAATRVLANPQLRTSEGVAAQARFGERVPVPVTTFAPIAAGGVQSQPITSFNYENIGVNIDITPRTHHDDDVSLALRVELSAISGTGFGGLPTFGSRSINTVIRLRDGETNMLAGLIRDDERRVMAGVPGLSDLPVIGRLFAYNRRETQETDILLTLTPHIVRVLDLDESDLRPFRVDRDPGTNVELTLPATVVPVPPRAQPVPPAGTDTGASPAPGTAPTAPVQPIKPLKPGPPPSR